MRILIADDHAIFRAGVKAVFAKTEDTNVVAEAASGEEALLRARETKPDIVLLDLMMPGRGGFETAHELKRRHPRVRVLMLSAHSEEQYGLRSLRDGADGYLSKGSNAEQLVQAVRKVHAGGKYISPALAEQLAHNLESGAKSEPHEALSFRELQVLRRIAAGRAVGEIAAELSLSVKTVSTYRTRLLLKMRLRTNAELMHYAFHHGLAE
jgi:two-component system, NarL family, invasion response regulator UvrY